MSQDIDWSVPGGVFRIERDARNDAWEKIVNPVRIKDATGTNRDLRLSEQGKVVATMDDDDVDRFVSRLWSQMLNRPVIVACSYCWCANAVSNARCVSCGAPMRAKE